MTLHTYIACDPRCRTHASGNEEEMKDQMSNQPSTSRELAAAATAPS